MYMSTYLDYITRDLETLQNAILVQKEQDQEYITQLSRESMNQYIIKQYRIYDKSIHDIESKIDSLESIDLQILGYKSIIRLLCQELYGEQLKNKK